MTQISDFKQDFQSFKLRKSVVMRNQRDRGRFANCKLTGHSVITVLQPLYFADEYIMGRRLFIV